MIWVGGIPDLNEPNELKFLSTNITMKIFVVLKNFSLACTCGHLQSDKWVIVNFIQPALVGLLISHHYFLFFTLFYEMGVLDCKWHNTANDAVQPYVLLVQYVHTHEWTVAGTGLSCVFIPTTQRSPGFKLQRIIRY